MGVMSAFDPRRTFVKRPILQDTLNDTEALIELPLVQDRRKPLSQIALVAMILEQ
jgi:hypothetical protein